MLTIFKRIIINPVLFTGFCLLFWGNGLVSQTELDERAFIEIRDAISIGEEDEFLLNLRFRMQNRASYFSKSSTNFSPEKFEAKVRRLRLRFDGYMGSKNLQYYIQLSFSRSDQNLEGGGMIAEVIRDAIVYYHFNEDFYIGFGQSKLPGNRQRITSSGNLQFADRSSVNSTFNIDRDFGFFAYYTVHPGNTLLRFKGAISTGNGRNAPALTNGLAYTGRIEWLPIGAFTEDGDFMEGDLYREKTPKLSIAAGGSFNHKAVKTDGQRGPMIMDNRDITTLYADFLLKYNGWAWSGEIMDKNVDNPIFQLDPESNFPNYMMKGMGVNTQLSYLTIGNWEYAFRYAIIRPDAEVSEFEAELDEILFGVTRYIKRHRVKIQGNIGYNEYSHIPEGLEGSFKSQWLVVFQLEFGL